MLELNRKQNCEEKLTFNTEREAGAAALQLKYNHATQVKPYLCRICNLWHLTTK